MIFEKAYVKSRAIRWITLIKMWGKMMSEIIRVSNVTKIYKIHEKSDGLKNGVLDFFHRKYKYKEAIRDVSFSIEKGQIVGLLGENGAGKTTMLKMLTGILFPSNGTIRVANYNPTDRKKSYLKTISFIMGNKADINWDLPAIDTFRYQQLVYNVSDSVFIEKVSMLSSLLAVTDLLKVPIRRLSLGERMKMELINNFLYSPEIVFLDEPTLGLDLRSQIAIRNFVKECRKEYNTTVIITSHYMDDIEETCDRVILLCNGEKTFDGDMKDIKNTNQSFKNIVMNMMKGVET